ncbi:hypothetical protein FRB94_009291 [Tulasnella sp. JGI-2019a]|nr:hypothetical protein FRB94_009291 [Tulasnella sp. JGI-2019a]KAG9025641.1 hypothetical protein FRB95_009938 [Tulasnella sp. JGI-2019a]
MNRWECGTTVSKSEALVVDLHEPSGASKRSLLEIVPQDGASSGLFLGVSYFPSSDLDVWILCSCHEGVSTPYPRAASQKNSTKTAASVVWTVAGNARELSATWVESPGLVERIVKYGYSGGTAGRTLAAEQ